METTSRFPRWILRAGLLGLVMSLPLSMAAVCGPQQRIVEAGRAPCVAHQQNRAPFFGETHAHTTYSFDAVLLDTRTDPRDAYAFAKGASIDLPPYDAGGSATRSTQLQRPLDFAILTDHAEYFGEAQVCLTPGYTGYTSIQCVRFRQAIAPIPGAGVPVGFQIFGFPLTVAAPARYAPVCGPGLLDCRNASESVWLDIQAAAEEAYDRTSSCAFTSFAGYEWTANTNFSNLHRNVVFRNEIVPARVTSYFEAQTPEELWAALQTDCIDGLPGCEALAIPHNSNISNGLMFDTTDATAESNALRAAWEPLIEITQHKGESECRTGVGNNDENCSFEKLDWVNIFAAAPDPGQDFPPQNFVRNGLLEGLVQQNTTGVNPFHFGFVGGTDTHSSTPGATEEDHYAGHLGFIESRPEWRLRPPVTVPQGVIDNPGGLTVLWAEENARESLWRAMERREAYATSGTRPVVRFFGGHNIPADMCQAADYAATGYNRGVPMGANLTAYNPTYSGAPRFSVLALQDAGTLASPGTPLQRVQIIKGWTDADGNPQEQVYDVAGDPNNGASVDTNTCTPQGSGFSSLCTVWQDPSFQSDQPAFYYARVLENPSCRWSKRECNASGITCTDGVPSQAGYETCCDGTVPDTIQERAWTSPIWYTPNS